MYTVVKGLGNKMEDLDFLMYDTELALYKQWRHAGLVAMTRVWIQRVKVV